MRKDDLGQYIYNENDLCDIYLKYPDINLLDVFIDKDIDFSKLELDNIPKCKVYKHPRMSREKFDAKNQESWFMPVEYYNMDIAKYILDQCNSDSELQRAGQELLLYQEREMFNLLKYLKYLVDTMRKHNIVWGVGRGSSVSSFVLYLLGVHRINSLYYDLPIEEFLK
jgi:DNA polymerase III alpha subunit